MLQKSNYCRVITITRTRLYLQFSLNKHIILKNYFLNSKGQIVHQKMFPYLTNFCNSKRLYPVNLSLRNNVLLSCHILFLFLYCSQPTVIAPFKVLISKSTKTCSKEGWTSTSALSIFLLLTPTPYFTHSYLIFIKIAMGWSWLCYCGIYGRKIFSLLLRSVKFVTCICIPRDSWNSG